MKKRKSRTTLKLFLIAMPLIIIILIILAGYDGRFFKTAVEITHMTARQRSNNAIDAAVKNNITKMGLATGDFFVIIDGGMLSANTMLINEFAGNVSRDVTEYMSEMSSEKVLIPIGLMTGVSFLANAGPSVGFVIRPMGAALVEPETSFTAAGINQTNYKVWINVTLETRIVNPLREETVVLSRGLILVDTIIKGEVPESYFDFGRYQN